MMRRSFAPLAALGAALALGGCATGLTGSRGYGASGTFEARFDANKRVVADFGVAAREKLARFELRSVSLVDAADPKHGMPAPIPANVVIVVDQGTRELTVWSPQSKHYFRSPLDKIKETAAGAGAPLPDATASPGARSGGGWLAMLKALKSVTMTMNVAGNELVDGHKTTALDIAISQTLPPPPATAQHPAAVRTPAAPMKIVVHANLADEYDGFPLAVRARMGSPGPGKPPLEVRLHMRDVRNSSPPESDFRPPEGYESATNPAELLAPAATPQPG